MDVIAQFGFVVDGFDDALYEIARVRGCEAYAAHSGHLASLRKQLRKIKTGIGRIAIAVYILAEQLDFGVAKFGE